VSVTKTCYNASMFVVHCAHFVTACLQAECVCSHSLHRGLHISLNYSPWQVGEITSPSIGKALELSRLSSMAFRGLSIVSSWHCCLPKQTLSLSSTVRRLCTGRTIEAGCVTRSADNLCSVLCVCLGAMSEAMLVTSVF
jgi:hypothetical protein